MARQRETSPRSGISMSLSLGRWVLLLLFMTVLSPTPADTQIRSIDVLITVVKDRVVALPGGGSPVEEPLGVNETIVTTVAHGPAGFAQTNRRLLGFSSALHRWTEVHLGVEEQVEQHRVFPRVLLVQTNRQVYGFQESRGHWFSEALGPNEPVQQLQGRGHVVVAITPERALAFSAFTGGFFSVRFSANEHVQSIDQANDVTLVRTTARQLAFRSQIGLWTEMR
ncbi:MAG: hypothetical protein U0236_19630 [Nitrospira sp.]